MAPLGAEDSDDDELKAIALICVALPNHKMALVTAISISGSG